MVQLVAVKILVKYLKIRSIIHVKLMFHSMVNVYSVAYLQAAAGIRLLKLFLQELNC